METIFFVTIFEISFRGNDWTNSEFIHHRASAFEKAGEEGASIEVLILLFFFVNFAFEK